MRTVYTTRLARFARQLLEECNALLARYTQCIPQRFVERFQNYARNRKFRNYSMALPRKDIYIIYTRRMQRIVGSLRNCLYTR